MYESGKLAICKYCKSYENGKCKDYFEQGVTYPCINYLRQDDEDKRTNN